MELVMLLIAILGSIFVTTIFLFFMRWVLDISTIINNQEQTNKYLKELSEQNNEILKKLRQ